MTPRKRATPSAADVAAYVERLGSVLSEAGIPPMPARVFAALLCTESGTATAADLVERLQISPAAVSGAVRYLIQVSLINRERELGGRRDVYRLGNDVWYQAIGNRGQLLQRWGSAFDDGAQLFGATGAAGERLAESRRFMDFLLQDVSSTLDRWRAYDAKHRPSRRR